MGLFVNGVGTGINFLVFLVTPPATSTAGFALNYKSSFSPNSGLLAFSANPVRKLQHSDYKSWLESSFLVCFLLKSVSLSPKTFRFGRMCAKLLISG